MIPVIVGAGVLGVVGLATWLLNKDDEPETILEKNFVSLCYIMNGSLDSEIIESLSKNTLPLDNLLLSPFLYMEKMKNHKKFKKLLGGSLEGKKILILGQPGAGKSSLLWSITNKKCSPKPLIGQQTDATHWHDKEMTDEFFTYHKDTVYVDIPGYGTTTHPYESYIKFFPFELFDLTIFMINGKIKESDEKIMERLREVNKEDLSKNLLIVQNFCENTSDNERKDIKEDMNKYFSSKKEGLDIIFTSNKTQEGMDTVKHFINK